MRPPYDEGPAVGTSGAGDEDHASGNPERFLTATNKIKGQVCEHCGRKLSVRSHGAPGRARRFCSDVCRQGARREKVLFERAGYNLPPCHEIESKTPSNSIGCETKIQHQCHSAISVPIDLLGRGHRWRGQPCIDAALRAKILWREACAP
jgi:hypothetical protein